MAQAESANLETVRHALRTARERGFAEVELEGEGLVFRARLDPLPKRAARASTADAPATPPLHEVKAPLVGYYRATKEPLAVGRSVKAGEVVANVIALGLANDVESKVEGEVVEVLVSDGQPVEYGQVLARVGKP